MPLRRARAVVAQQDVVRSFRGPRRGGDLAHAVEEAGLQRDLRVNCVEVPARMLPSQHLLRHYHGQADAQLLRLGHLVVIYHVASMLGQREMTIAYVQRRAVADMSPVSGHLRQRRRGQERGGHAQFVQHLCRTGANRGTDADRYRRLAVAVGIVVPGAFLGVREHVADELLGGLGRECRLGTERAHL
ncbi:hypothetical protein DLJ57_21870 [Micromonospora chalcea]|nr:hypothetical protein DLJ57_21870 [Micromonospora chalcea]